MALSKKLASGADIIGDSNLSGMVLQGESVYRQFCAHGPELVYLRCKLFELHQILVYAGCLNVGKSDLTAQPNRVNKALRMMRPGKNQPSNYQK